MQQQRKIYNYDSLKAGSYAKRNLSMNIHSFYYPT